MGCSKEKKEKLMASIRRQYPAYSLARRKRILNGILYRNRYKK